MTTIRRSRPDEGDRAVEIWRGAVDATHNFLSREDRLSIEKMVGGFLPQAPLWFAVDADDYPLARTTANVPDLPRNVYPYRLFM